MIRQLIAMLTPALVAAAAMAQTPAADPSATRPSVMKAGEIGPIKLSFRQADLLSLGFPMEREDTNIEGDPVAVYTIGLSKTVSVQAWFYETGSAFWLRTEASSFATPEGARVGDTLAQLKRRYPNGRLYWGSDEPGPFFHFFTGPFEAGKPAAAFDFDYSDLSTACVRKHEGCPDFADRPSIAFKTVR